MALTMFLHVKYKQKQEEQGRKSRHSIAKRQIQPSFLKGTLLH